MSFLFGSAFEIAFCLMCWELFEVAGDWMMSYFLPPPPEPWRVVILAGYFSVFAGGFFLNAKRKTLTLPAAGALLSFLAFAVTLKRVIFTEEGVVFRSVQFEVFLKFLPAFVLTSTLSLIFSPPQIKRFSKQTLKEY